MRKSSISKATSEEKIGEFWDTHDFTEFDTDAPDVHFDVILAVPLENKLYSAIAKEAKRRGVSLETLVNLWLQEKLIEETAR